MDRHRLSEERSVAFHDAIARRLSDEPGLIDAARARVDGWRRDGSVRAEYIAAWSAALALPLVELQALLVNPGEDARALRQVTPFAGALDPRERWRIWRAVRAAAGP